MWIAASIILGLTCIALIYQYSKVKHNLYVNQVILDMSMHLSSTFERKSLLQLIMTKTAEALQSEGSSIILMDQETGDLYFEVATGKNSEQVQRIRLPAGEGIAGWVQIHGQSVLIPDVKKDARWSRKVADETEVTTRNMLCAPIFSNGVLLGVIQVINKKNNQAFKKDELRLLEQLSSPIAMSLENMMLYEALKNSMDSLQETTATKEKILSEMRLAREIQGSLLPGESLKYGKIELEARLLPAREVGGDFYHFFMLDDEHMLVCLGDVSDKGMPAALFMSALMIWIKAKAVPGISVSALIESINEELSTETSTMFATLFISIINVKSGKMSYCDAGHCPVYVVFNNQIETLPTQKGLPIGIMPGAKYTASEYQMQNSSQIVMYTDGITEAENESGKWYSSDQLEAFIQHNTRFHVDYLIQDVQRFAGTNPQSDDIAVLSILFNDKSKSN